MIKLEVKNDPRQDGMNGLTGQSWALAILCAQRLSSQAELGTCDILRAF